MGKQTADCHFNDFVLLSRTPHSAACFLKIATVFIFRSYSAPPRLCARAFFALKRLTAGCRCGSHRPPRDYGLNLGCYLQLDEGLFTIGRDYTCNWTLIVTLFDHGPKSIICPSYLPKSP